MAAKKKSAPRASTARKKRASGFGLRVAAGKQRAEPKARPRPPKSQKRVVARPEEPRSAPPSRSPKPDARAPTGPTAAKRRDWARPLPVVDILDDPYPIGALRRFLDSIKGEASPQQAQIALGSAQLLLLPSARENRGGAEVKEIVDMVLERWDDFGERRTGFHAQELLRSAFAAVGVDRPRIARLAARVPPGATSDLLFGIACAHAVARDKVAMLRAVEQALAAGATSDQFRRDLDFAPYATDPDLATLLARADVPPIPVDVDPHRAGVRAALDSLVATLRELGMKVELRPPVRLDTILDAERAAKVSLPNDYRALLTITNGMRAWDHEFFGAGDFRELTTLAARAHRWVHVTAEQGTRGVTECVPLASWGHPSDWLVYDPRGSLRGGAPGYVLCESAGESAVPDLITALARMESTARDVLGTN
jgi:hypothetical protein